jgi:hypothetical protein
MTTHNILNSIRPRLVPVDRGDPILGLEVLDGPYKGITFSFSKFIVQKERMKDGMVPTKFETQIHEAPTGFVPDESFDLFCSEVLLAWLSYISMSNLDSLIKEETKGVH